MPFTALLYFKISNMKVPFYQTFQWLIKKTNWKPFIKRKKSGKDHNDIKKPNCQINLAHKNIYIYKKNRWSILKCTKLNKNEVGMVFYFVYKLNINFSDFHAIVSIVVCWLYL